MKCPHCDCDVPDQHPGAQVQNLRVQLDVLRAELKGEQLRANGLEMQLKEALAQGQELAKRLAERSTVSEQPDLAHAAMVLGKGIYLHGLVSAAATVCATAKDSLCEVKAAREFLTQAFEEETNEEKPK